MDRNWCPAACGIHAQTSSQTITTTSYLIKPISDQLSRMFRER
jgi:hypothetical protein